MMETAGSFCDLEPMPVYKAASINPIVAISTVITTGLVFDCMPLAPQYPMTAMYFI